MLTFGVISFLRWRTSGELFFLLLFFRDSIAAFFLVRREKAQVNGSNLIATIAYISSGIPLLYFSAPYGMETKLVKLSADLLATVGFLVVSWATIDLGTKLGVSPAKRGEKVTRGLYRFTNHPMYLGYTIAQFGWLFINNWNLPIYTASIILFFIRAKQENKILN
jgi:protein-S-isoprenylcysteine O-methyltransferase Ste14